MLPIDTYIQRLTYYIVSTDDQSVTQAGKDRLKAKIGDAQLAASEPPGAAGEAAPAASAAVGSALESGMASGVAAAPDAEHVDDAGTPHRTFKLAVCFWQPTYALQLELSTSCDAFVPLLVSRQIHSVLAALVTARALIMRFMENVSSQPVSKVGREKQCCVANETSSKMQEEGSLGLERARAEEEHHSQASAEKTRSGKTMSGRTAIKKEPTGDSNGDAPGVDSVADVHPEDGKLFASELNFVQSGEHHTGMPQVSKLSQDTQRRAQSSQAPALCR